MTDYKLSKINLTKISHDIDQLVYLKSRGLGTAEIELLIENLEILKSLIAQSGKKVVEVTDLMERLVGTDYLFSKVIDPPSAYPFPAVNTGAFGAPQVLSFADNKFKVYVFDGVLNATALAGVQRFCQEARIWFEIKENLKYLYTDQRYGLRCGLLTQIQEEMRLNLLNYLGQRKLTEAWAIKYDLKESGIPAHADQEAGGLTCNFWITPTSSNLDQAGGGMKILNLHAPQSWAWPVAITDEVRIAEYIREQRPEEICIPYRENRLILFNSELFHKTNAVNFGPNYQDRRVSLTFIYQ